MAKEEEWTSGRIFREILRESDRLNISYCLRLLHRDGCLNPWTKEEDKPFKILREMAVRLKISPTSLLTQKQAKLAAELMRERRLHFGLELIFRRILVAGEELLIDDADPKWLPALRADRDFLEKEAHGEAKRKLLEPEPKEEPSASAFLTPQWGIF